MAYNGYNGGNKGGYKPFDKKHYNDKPEGERSYGDRSGGTRRNRTEGSDARGYSRGGNREGGFGDKPYGKKPYGEKSFDKKPYGERSFDKKPYGDKPFGKKPYGEKSFDKKSYGDRENERSFDRKRPFDRDSRPERSVREQEPVENNAPQGGEDELPYLLIGRNAVREAVKNGRSIDRILVVEEQDGSLGEIITMARDRKLVIRECDRRKLDELCMPFGHGGRTANHQGIVAYAAGVEYCEIADILAYAEEKGEQPFVIVLDGIEDPYNLGSIIRSAECAGAHGVIIPKRRSASVTSATVKSAAGATEYVKIARVVNTAAALDQLKQAGLWIAGTDMGGTPMQQQDLTGPIALVIGSEGDGMSKIVRDNCDYIVSIPMHGRIDSLNAGVAAAVLMFEKRRQDSLKA